MVFIFPPHLTSGFIGLPHGKQEKRKLHHFTPWLAYTNEEIKQRLQSWLQAAGKEVMLFPCHFCVLLFDQSIL